MHIALFASGTGSNALKIIAHLQPKYPELKISIWSNNSEAPILKSAESLGIETHLFNRQQFSKSNHVLEMLKKEAIDFIALAGFLWLVPSPIVREFPNQIINIHPALLPKYGGKGMFGMNVHKAVKENGDKESGITIHFVNENYDEGNVILQASCEIQPENSAETIAKKVLALEHKHFPLIVEEFVARN
ncbi:MAG: phosphoribosylglycinamide formyltransferase-1 [Flammeovirgaceae bacterium]|jgi:phosphoribosylglycinamide formyltransferase-1